MITQQSTASHPTDPDAQRPRRQVTATLREVPLTSGMEALDPGKCRKMSLGLRVAGDDRLRTWWTDPTPHQQEQRPHHHRATLEERSAQEDQHSQSGDHHLALRTLEPARAARAELPRENHAVHGVILTLSGVPGNTPEARGQAGTWPEPAGAQASTGPACAQDVQATLRWLKKHLPDSPVQLAAHARGRWHHTQVPVAAGAPARLSGMTLPELLGQQEDAQVHVLIGLHPVHVMEALKWLSAEQRREHNRARRASEKAAAHQSAEQRARDTERRVLRRAQAHLAAEEARLRRERAGTCPVLSRRRMRQAARARVPGSNHTHTGQAQRELQPCPQRPWRATVAGSGARRSATLTPGRWMARHPQQTLNMRRDAQINTGQAAHTRSTSRPATPEERYRGNAHTHMVQPGEPQN